MRLVIATPLYPPEPGGPASYSKILEEELPKLGWEVEVVKFSDARHLPKLFCHIVYGYRIYKAAQKADVVLALDPVSTGLPACIASTCARKKFFVKIVGDYAWEQGVQRFSITETLDSFVLNKKVPFFVGVLRSIETYVARSAVCVIVPSEYLKGIVRAWGIHEEKISVVYNSPPLPVAYVKGDRPIKDSYIVTVARLVQWKGVSAVIQAIQEVVAEHPQLRLVIVGDGPERASLEKQVRDLKLIETVIFVGSVSHEQTLGYIAHADAFILNTQYEGLSHTILEAFTVRTPVLTTRAGGNTELIEDGVTGLFFTADDVSVIAQTIHRIQENHQLRAFLTTHARVRIEAFSQERMLHGLLHVLSL